LHPTALAAATSTVPRALWFTGWRWFVPATAQRVKTTVSGTSTVLKINPKADELALYYAKQFTKEQSE
jgi:hypothetical protein